MEDKQKLVDICFQIAFTVQRNKSLIDMPHEQLAEWVITQLKNSGFETMPCGASWGVLINKEKE